MAIFSSKQEGSVSLLKQIRISCYRSKRYSCSCSSSSSDVVIVVTVEKRDVVHVVVVVAVIVKCILRL